MSTSFILRNSVLLKLAACIHVHPSMPATTYLSSSSNTNTPLSLSRLKRIREHPNITLNRPLVPQKLHISPIDPDLAFLALLLVLVTAERREAPVLGNDDLLAPREFVLRATEGFDGGGAVCTDYFQSVIDFRLHTTLERMEAAVSWNVRLSRVRTESRICPMFTRATVPFGLPHAPRIPVCSLSAPAHDNILLMRTTWYGWARTRRWNPSLPATLTRYL